MSKIKKFGWEAVLATSILLKGSQPCLPGLPKRNLRLITISPTCPPDEEPVPAYREGISETPHQVR
jgi:hypothetical protein